jgi:hypothetical protein
LVLCCALVSMCPAVTSDVLALVDFYRENDLIETVTGPDGTPTSRYPVNAVEMQPIAVLEKLYQQFVVSSFGAETRRAER